MSHRIGVLMLALRCGHGSDIIVKMHCFFGGLLLYSRARIRQTEGMAMMSQARSTSRGFHDPWGRNPCARV